LKEKKILLAEDDPDHAELIIDELNTGDIRKEIILKKNGQEVIDYFQEIDIDSSDGKESQIDLIILDLNLPEINGMDILKSLKGNLKYSSIPVVILSTNSDQNTILEAYNNGSNSYVAKPISYDEFVDKIKMLRKDMSVTTPPDAMTVIDTLKSLTFDLLISVINMPGNTGLELIKKLQEIAEGLPVILVTGSPFSETQIQSLKPPVTACLNKPLDFEELLMHVRSSIKCNTDL
jgi:DNA-binding response OmpR family regulator